MRLLISVLAWVPTLIKISLRYKPWEIFILIIDKAQLRFMLAITIQFSQPQYEMIGNIKSNTITTYFTLILSHHGQTIHMPTLISRPKGTGKRGV